jgi:ergothioneine biosynthesis protein EgtB
MSVRPHAASPVSELIRRLLLTRRQSEQLAAPLSPEDCQAQSMPDASPVKWHLAHVTWFFETLVLEPREVDFRPWNQAYRVLFNSYYLQLGARHPRPARGLLTRPTLAEVLAWRSNVDERLTRLLEHAPDPELCWLVELGIQHEQQHQELLLTDVKHLLWSNPLRPAYLHASAMAVSVPGPRLSPVATSWLPTREGLVMVGRPAGERSFHFDNEAPLHRVHLAPFQLAAAVVSNQEWRDFVEAGGYLDPRWWLDAGWAWRCAHEVTAPLYWSAPEAQSGSWQEFTLAGMRDLVDAAPACHVSYFEADAYARWRSATHVDSAGCRLATEFEWETWARSSDRAIQGNFLESGALHPLPQQRSLPGPAQLFGDVWEWTASSYAPYPGYRPWSGAVGEYNGKFMIDQMVLRGGSCVTPQAHIRASYRNFFPTAARWQFSGVRLARHVA